MGRSLNRPDADGVTAGGWSLIPVGVRGAQWTLVFATVCLMFITFCTIFIAFLHYNCYFLHYICYNLPYICCFLHYIHCFLSYTCYYLSCICCYCLIFVAVWMTFGAFSLILVTLYDGVCWIV